MIWRAFKRGTVVGAVIGLVFMLGAIAAQAVECEVEGEIGFVTVDSTCMTPSRYDAMFSYENLSTIPLQDGSGESIAEAYGITSASAPASERLLGVGLVEEPYTFRTWLSWQIT